MTNQFWTREEREVWRSLNWDSAPLEVGVRTEKMRRILATVEALETNARQTANLLADLYADLSLAEDTRETLLRLIRWNAQLVAALEGKP